MKPRFYTSIPVVIAAFFAVAILAGTSHAAVSKGPIVFEGGASQLLGSAETGTWSLSSAALNTRPAKRVQVAYRYRGYRSHYGRLPYCSSCYGGIPVYRPKIYYPRVYRPSIYYPRVYVPRVYVPRVYRGYYPRAYGGYRYRYR